MYFIKLYIKICIDVLEYRFIQGQYRIENELASQI